MSKGKTTIGENGSCVHCRSLHVTIGRRDEGVKYFNCQDCGARMVERPSHQRRLTSVSKARLDAKEAG